MCLAEPPANNQVWPDPGAILGGVRGGAVDESGKTASLSFQATLRDAHAVHDSELLAKGGDEATTVDDSEAATATATGDGDAAAEPAPAATDASGAPAPTAAGGPRIILFAAMDAGTGGQH